jgi:hypothetical protein
VSSKALSRAATTGAATGSASVPEPVAEETTEAARSGEWEALQVRETPVGEREHRTPARAAQALRTVETMVTLIATLEKTTTAVGMQQTTAIS